MIGQPPVGKRAKALLQRTVEPRFQSSSGYRHSSLADLAAIATIPQLQGTLEDVLHAAGELSSSRSRHQDHLAATT